MGTASNPGHFNPASWTFSTDGAATDLTAALVTYRGPNAANPVAITDTATTASSTEHALPQVTVDGDAHHLVHVAGYNGNATSQPPQATTERVDQTGTVSLFVADTYQSRPGTSPDADATTSAAVSSASLTVGIIPAATAQQLGYAGHSDSPSHLADDTGALIERYLAVPGGVTVTQTAETQPIVLFADDFTGTTAADWNATKWSTTSNDTTKNVDLDSNQGRLYVNGSSARGTALMDPVDDSEARFSYRFTDRNATSFLRVTLRASGGTPPAQLTDGYRFEVRSDSTLVKSNASTTAPPPHSKASTTPRTPTPTKSDSELKAPPSSSRSGPPAPPNPPPGTSTKRTPPSPIRV